MIGKLVQLTGLHARTNKHTHTTPTHTRVYTHTCIYTKYPCIHRRTHTHTHIYTRMYIHTHVHIHKHIHTHTHTAVVPSFSSSPSSPPSSSFSSSFLELSSSFLELSSSSSSLSSFVLHALHFPLLLLIGSLKFLLQFLHLYGSDFDPISRNPICKRSEVLVSYSGESPNTKQRCGGCVARSAYLRAWFRRGRPFS